MNFTYAVFPPEQHLLRFLSLSVWNSAHQPIPLSSQWAFLQHRGAQSQASPLSHPSVVSLLRSVCSRFLFLFTFFSAIPHWATWAWSRWKDCSGGKVSKQQRERIGRSHAKSEAAQRWCLVNWTTDHQKVFLPLWLSPRETKESDRAALRGDIKSSSQLTGKKTSPGRGEHKKERQS